MNRVRLEGDLASLRAHEAAEQLIADAGAQRQEIAARLGVTKSTITGLLRRDRHMKVRTLGRIAAAVGKRLNFAFEDLE